MLLKSRTAHIRPSFFSEPFLRFTLDFLVLIRKSSEKNWAWWLLQSKTWHFIECRNSSSYRLKDNCTGIKIFKFQISARVATERHMSTCIWIGTCHVVHGRHNIKASKGKLILLSIAWISPLPQIQQLGPNFECFRRMKSHDYNVIRHIWHWLTIFIPEWQFKCVLRWPAWRNLESKYNVM